MTDINTDYFGDNFKRIFNDNKTSDNGTGNEKEYENQDLTLSNQRANEYVKELLGEKLTLDQQKQPNCMRFIEQGSWYNYLIFFISLIYLHFIEVLKTQQLGRVPARENKYVDIYREKPIKISVKVLVPVREHPKVIPTLLDLLISSFFFLVI